MEVDPKQGNEKDPGSGGFSVKYGGVPNQKFYTPIAGKHQNLPNGNILVTEALAGRVFEVNQKGDIVWEFINRYDENTVLTITQAIRYPEQYFAVQHWACD